MYVCICRAVTDKQVKASIQAGAETLAEVRRACGAGGDCGGCHGVIDEMIEEHREACAATPACRRLPLTSDRAA